MTSTREDLTCRHCAHPLKAVQWVQGTVWVIDDGQPGHDPSTAICPQHGWHQPIRSAA